MMLHSADQIKADKKAIDAGRCPETGIDLTKVDVGNHLSHHFPHMDDPEHITSDYGRRARLIRSWADARNASKGGE